MLASLCHFESLLSIMVTMWIVGYITGSTHDQYCGYLVLTIMFHVIKYSTWYNFIKLILRVGRNLKR